MRAKVMLLSLTAMLSGCYYYPLGEVGVGVTGRIVSEVGTPLNDCTIAKRYPEIHGDLEIVREATRSEISFYWLRGFNGRIFQIVIRCPGYAQPFVSKRYREGDFPETGGAIDLGTIMMKQP